MNDIFRHALCRYVLYIFVNIQIYSPSAAQHYRHLQSVLTTLAQNEFCAKYSKCTFGVDQIDYLGHVISATGVTADPSKLEAIRNWP